MWLRLMELNDGSWVKFKKNSMDVLVSDFVSGESIIEMDMEGCKLILFL